MPLPQLESADRQILSTKRMTWSQISLSEEFLLIPFFFSCYATRALTLSDFGSTGRMLVDLLSPVLEPVTDHIS